MTARHGTTSGYVAHQHAGETPCPPCWQAKSDYDKRRLSAPEKTRKNRLGARAQGRALSRLRALYPDIYRVLYEEARAEVFAEDGGDT